MKFIPNAIARKVASKQLLASEHSPTILFGVGVVGMVGSTVLACRATLKMSELLDEVERQKQQAKDVKELVDSGHKFSEPVEYTDKEYARDLSIISVKGVGSIAKLYAPSVILGAVSIACLTKSHNILKDRNLALTAAYTAVNTAFANYRERVIAKHGRDEDRQLMYDTEEVTIIDPESGKELSTTKIIDGPGSIYARWFTKESSSSWHPDPDIRIMHLNQVQRYCNDRLRARGHMFLNEVYEELGLSHTRAGAVVGWRWNQNSGDDHIDFGIWEGVQVDDFFVDEEGGILLDFNVDGPIWDKIDEADL